MLLLLHLWWDCLQDWNDWPLKILMPIWFKMNDAPTYLHLGFESQWLL